MNDMMFSDDTSVYDDPNKTTGVYARFYIFPEVNQEKSAEAGRPIFVDKEYIEIIAPGNSNNIIRRRASDRDVRLYRSAYDKFKAGDQEQLEGTPLYEIPWISRSQAEELVYRKIRTVEQLASLSDSACNVPGTYELKRKAAAWIKKSEEAAPFTALAKENEDLRARLAALEQAMTTKKSA